MLNPYFGGLRTKSVLCVPPAHLILVVGGLGVSGLLAWTLPEPLGKLGWREEISINCITLKSRLAKHCIKTKTPFNEVLEGAAR